MLIGLIFTANWLFKTNATFLSVKIDIHIKMKRVIFYIRYHYIFRYSSSIKLSEKNIYLSYFSALYIGFISIVFSFRLFVAFSFVKRCAEDCVVKSVFAIENLLDILMKKVTHKNNHKNFFSFVISYVFTEASFCETVNVSEFFKRNWWWNIDTKENWKIK